ncbi:acyl-CoA dehydrogenase [Billgrantia tianxiuensis]|jgi:alkylation response protein AidB-like acyl-CoA dehydrogenase|uniref:3-methylmercaptopropionyl-CoA dehydrogenase n=1 Tax=Billgrantia tianxiuensis TaxID=2497861 RepID=A0A6I6SW58_9GAMM|nr:MULTISPECIES: acyl-CoA dehydrogenase [Halomonas]MCE8035491.1 acyl-CoA dehydrogenase [Halomonas sp. MCCC 1A11057]QHC51623.1 acyl-CoA dehydrogenase [Halomonas tianxiuensis]
MLDYQAPLRDMQFILEELAGLERIGELPGCEDASPDLVSAVLEEAGKFAAGVLAPLNTVGDRQGCRLEGERVVTPEGWQAAYDRFREAGWIGLSLPPEHGGQGLPKLVSTPVWEMWFASNMAFAMLPQLNVGQTEALMIAASEEQKATWLAKIVSGEWAATMNLTEPQAGSDLAATRMRAEPEGDGAYRLFGQKIFISYGEHELTPNIVHLVLARLPDAPPGVKGLSLFLVPKYLLDERGEPGPRNDIRCIAIEHKMGIHGSPTCTLSYGDDGGALGYLVGEPHQGLATMFVMMNEARFNVGVQGVALGERAYQAALAYARERVQGRDIVTGEVGLPILAHPDVKRMLVSMRARLMAMRGLLYSAAGWFDLARHHPDAEVADKHRHYVDLLMPVAKGWCTEVGNDLCDEAIQVFGGMGFVEETGVAQLFRDARVITIYEGTTGIQANDLLGRKILREDAATLRELIADIRQTAGRLDGHEHLNDLAQPLHDQATLLDGTVDWLLAHQADTAKLYAGAVPLLHLLGIACGAWQMARLALAAETRRAAGEGDPDYLTGLSELARFYLATQAPQAQAHGHTLRHAGAVLARFPERGL